MKINRISKVYRPMREFGKLLKDLFNPKKPTHFWIRIKKEFHTKEEKEYFIYSTIELLDNETKVKQ